MADSLSQTFAALSDPTRRAILARLSKGDANVSDLAEPFLRVMSLPAITKHLKVLEKAGLVTKTREAQWRPCRLNLAPLKDVADWMETYRAFWEESFDRLGEYLKTVTAPGLKNQDESQRKARSPQENLKPRSKNQKIKPVENTAKYLKGKKHGRKK